ncbi:MAG TPA: hypothetical protein VM529_10690 [Gemmata sp.]|nr:hypothetical protein [Gemmata sp.]
MTVRDAILLAVPVFTRHAGGGLSVIRNELENAGVPPQLAAELVEFLPLALARAMLDGMGVRFEDYYVRQTARGHVIGQKLLTDEPVFREGLAVANELSANSEEFMAVAGWSVEYQAINKAMNAGSRPEDLRCAPPVVFADHDDARPFDDTSAGPQSRPKPWWQFWK